QVATYLIAPSSTPHNIDITFLFYLGLQLYFLTAIGRQIIDSQGSKHFLALYWGGGIFVGIIASLTMLGGEPLLLVGPTYALHILAIGWAFLFPHSRMQLFLIIPMNTRTAVFGFIALQMIMSLLNGEIVASLITLSTLLYGYFYSLLAWNIVSPFERLHSFDKRAIYWKRRLLAPLSRKRKGVVYPFPRD
ncbi:MAG: rhomboid family intramembrane serine protease, partial [Chlamydiota bacterium]|nr:rhomboid family intramembrane serine protease [Chlamydiota bacterium]